MQAFETSALPAPDTMQRFLRTAGCLAALLNLATVPVAKAANVPQQMLDVNSQACVQMSQMPGIEKFDPQRPADQSRIPAYCACVSKAYWASVPQADYDGMLEEMQRLATQPSAARPHLSAIQAAEHERMKAAQSACH